MGDYFCDDAIGIFYWSRKQYTCMVSKSKVGPDILSYTLNKSNMSFCSYWERKIASHFISIRLKREIKQDIGAS